MYIITAQAKFAPVGGRSKVGFGNHTEKTTKKGMFIKFDQAFESLARVQATFETLDELVERVAVPALKFAESEHKNLKAFGRDICHTLMREGKIVKV